MGEIIIEESKYRTFAVALASLLLFLASLAIAIYGINRDQKKFYMWGIIVSIILLICFIVAVANAAKVKKLITITVDGIIDHSGLSGIGFISFDDIKEFQVVSFYRARAIAIIPKNMELFLSELSLVKRRQVKRNLIMKLPPVYINVELAKDMEPEDILSLLQKRLIDYSSLYE